MRKVDNGKRKKKRKKRRKKRKKKMPADATNGKAACFGVVTARERAFASLL